MKAPIRKQFRKEYNDLQSIVDVDDSAGRSVPTNMNFTEVGYLTKDTGSLFLGATETELCHSEFNYKKKDGTEYRIRAKGTYLQKYASSAWSNLSSGTVTMTIASPCVISQTAHGLKAGSKVSFTTTGALPTGITANTVYYVISAGLTADAFEISATEGGAAINTSGSQSGTHTMYRRYTDGSKFGFKVYDDTLYGGNASEYFFSWTGTAFAESSANPKGNIFEVFEDRLFVAGVAAEPLTLYYSNVGDATTFSGSDVIQPLGTDHIKGLVNYFGTLMCFKENSIYKITFQYDQVAAAFVPKIEVQSNNYGACSRQAITWVENELWFFTGREVRGIGYQSNNSGVFGVNNGIISDQIKETLKLIDIANFNNIATFYHNRRYYLAVPLGVETTNDTVFVCHLLYNKLWTKYTERIKSYVDGFIVVDDLLYTNVSQGTDYGTLLWDEDAIVDIDTAINSSVYFKKIENAEFNISNTYRYIDLLFKDLQGTVTITVKQDLHDSRTLKTNTFYVGSEVQGQENPLAEVIVGQSLVADSYGEEVDTSPFLRRKISTLIKAQAITIGLSNNSTTDQFTIAQMAISGFQEPSRYFNRSQITNIN